jgi:hypothetical protein
MRERKGRECHEKNSSPCDPACRRRGINTKPVRVRVLTGTHSNGRGKRLYAYGDVAELVDAFASEAYGLTTMRFESRRPQNHSSLE